MSIYPVFSIDSISNWCTKDVAEFIAQETAKNGTLKLETGFKLTTTGLDTKVACEKAIEPFVKFINDSLGGAKYVDAISTITDPTLQNKLWIARTFLFSQLMIFAVVILGKDNDYKSGKDDDKSGKDDESLSLYTEVFGEANGKTIFPFMPLSPVELKLYQMGIFGSKSPTSDIDVGIQYIGASTKPTLHYILSVFEQLFVTFTGKSSLDFDIEAYADLYLIRDDSGADYFYLDSGTFTQEDFVKMLQVAGLSIARNVLMDDPNALQPTFEQIKKKTSSLQTKVYNLSGGGSIRYSDDKNYSILESRLKIDNNLDKKFINNIKNINYYYSKNKKKIDLQNLDYIFEKTKEKKFNILAKNKKIKTK